MQSPLTGIPTIARIGLAVLALQPVFAIPVYFSVLLGAPQLWLGMILAVFPLLVRLVLTGRLFIRTPFDLPILIFLAGSVAGLIVSPDRVVALGGLASTFASVVVYYGLANNQRRGNRYWLTVGALVCAVTVGLSVWFFSEGTARLVVFNRWFFSLFKEFPKTGGPVLQFNSLGALLASVIPCLLAVALFKGHRLIRTVAAGFAVLFTAALVLTDSGGGWIACAAGVATVLCWWRWQSLFALVPSYGLAAGSAALFYHRVSWLAPSFSTGSLMTRFVFWGNTLRLLGGWRAVTGLGLGGWSRAYREAYADVQIHVHNSYLQQYVDAGVIGVATTVSAAVQFLFLGRDILHARRDDPWYGVAVGLIGGVVAGAVFAMYDVTTTVTVLTGPSYIYMSVPFLWVWAALLVVARDKLLAPAR